MTSFGQEDSWKQLKATIMLAWVFNNIFDFCNRNEYNNIKIEINHFFLDMWEQENGPLYYT